MYLSKTIHQLRKEHKMTQKDLGDRLGVSNRAISKWEKGLSMPSARNLFRLAEIFHLSADTFFPKKSTELQKESLRTMDSLLALYRIGRGPSSSHTIGPEQACLRFRKLYPEADSFEVILFGSLAKTGRGHGTDSVIRKTMAPLPCRVTEDPYRENLPHPNTMELIAFSQKEEIGRATVLSVGGGSIRFLHESEDSFRSLYPHSRFSDISQYCKENDLRLWEYVLRFEDPRITRHVKEVWNTMKESIRRGLEEEGTLPGGLGVRRKAKTLYYGAHMDESAETRENRLVCSFAFAVSEENASGRCIVTAPTCGSAGVLPSVLFYQQRKHHFEDEAIHHALLTAGLIGNLIKTNASISGAECGCQAEIGSACAMAAAALGELFGLETEKIEYAAEIAIEHHLGLTCDPICGLVQIPCIERNAVAAMRAINALSLANLLWDTRMISLDRVIQAMKETGHDLSPSYKETSEGGLAKISLPPHKFEKKS